MGKAGRPRERVYRSRKSRGEVGEGCPTIIHHKIQTIKKNQGREGEKKVIGVVGNNKKSEEGGTGYSKKTL